jgi:hypothetical protein
MKYRTFVCHPKLVKSHATNFVCQPPKPVDCASIAKLEPPCFFFCSLSPRWSGYLSGFHIDVRLHSSPVLSFSFLFDLLNTIVIQIARLNSLELLILLLFPPLLSQPSSIKMGKIHRSSPLSLLSALPLMSLIKPSASQPLILPRYVPPSMYVDGAKLSAKIIILIVIFTLVTVLLSTCTCYICCKRSRAKSRRKRLAREAAESKTLKPRINKRNAKFFAPGLHRQSYDSRGSSSLRGSSIELPKYGSWMKTEEVKRPERTHLDLRGTWRKIMRGEPIAGDGKDERLRGGV